LRILPLRGGSIGCAQLASGDSAGAIFELGRGVELTAEEQQLSTLFSGVRLVDSVFSHELASSRDASSLLVQLGVLQLSSDDFLRSHVISALANGQTPPTELPLLFHLARRLAPHTRSLRSHALARCLLDARAQLLASDGSVCRLGECLALHLSCELEPSLTYVPAELPGWLVLDRAYVQAEADLVSLKSLLLTLGLADFPAIVQSTPSAVASTSSTVVSTDWASPSCDALLAALCAAGDLKRLKQFATALSERWPVLSQRATRGAPPSSVPSAFALSLRRHTWLEGSDGKLHRPQELWTRTRELEDILGASGAVWATASFSDDLASVLGVRTRLSADLAISLLTLWAAEPEYISTIDQMAAMLRWLKPVVEVDEAVRATLKTIPCIWLPDRSEIEVSYSKLDGTLRKVPSGRVTGRFYAPRECVRRDPAGLVDSFKKTVTEEVVKLVARARIRIRCLSSYYEGHGLERFFEVVGVAAEPQLEHLVAILTVAGESGEPCATSLTAVYRVFGSLAFSDQEQRREHDDLQEDEEDDEEEAAGGRVAQRKRDLSIGEQIAQAVGEAAVFPTANGRWSRLSDVYFFSTGSLIEDAAVRWSALANAHALECRPPGPPYDAHRLKQLHKSENRPENFVKDLEANLLTFYSNVLQLQPIARFVRQAISASDAYAVPVNSSLRVCAAAGVLQRWSASSASSLSRSAQQREALQASLASLRLYHATAITVHDELTTKLGDLLESSSDGAAHVFLRRGEGMPELFLTSTATPRAFVHEMAKLLPEPVQRAEAAMAMMTLIESIWSWETLNSAISADMLHSALCGTDHGLGDMPMIAASELWLGWNSSAGTGAVASLANASSEAEKRPLKETSVADLHTAMEREQALLSRWNVADAVGDVVGAFEAGPADVDVALAASLSRLKELRNLPRAAPNLPVLGNVYAGLGGAFVNAHDNAGLVGAASGGGAGVSVGASGGVGSGDGGNCGGSCSGDGDCAGGSGGGGSGGGGSSGILGGEPSINHSTHDFPVRIDVDAWETLCVQPTVVAMADASSVERQMSTGRWGEQLVAWHLRKTLASAEVTWVNEEEERGLPYDIIVTELGGAIGSRNDSYVEVKATSSADKPLFEMSVAELEFARAHGAAYSLYRVFNANSEHVRVLKLHNVARSLTNGGLVLFAGAAPAAASSLSAA
jgi:hypothetical protein